MSTCLAGKRPKEKGISIQDGLLHLSQFMTYSKKVSKRRRKYRSANLDTENENELYRDWKEKSGICVSAHLCCQGMWSNSTCASFLSELCYNRWIVNECKTGSKCSEICSPIEMHSFRYAFIKKNCSFLPKKSYFSENIKRHLAILCCVSY